MDRAIVCFVEARGSLIQQLLALRRSLRHAGSTDTDLVVFGPPEALAELPDDVVRIAQQPTADDPAWGDYRFVNSIACVNGAGADRLDDYGHVLRSDVDTFVTPAWDAFRPATLTTGRGRYAHGDEVRGRIRGIAAEYGLDHRGLTDVGSTWYGPLEVVRRTAAFTEMLTRQILTRHFRSGWGAWPGWWRGVALLYAAEIAVNHCAPDAVVSPLLDADSTSREPTTSVAHIHCWHTESLFSKFAMERREYRREDHPDPDLDVIAEFCLEMALRSLEDLGVGASPAVPSPGVRP